MGRSLVIINPNASQARDRAARTTLRAQLVAALEQRDGSAPRIVETSSEEDTRPAVEVALAEGVNAVVGVGGDGTMREIAAILMGTGVPLGIIPAGTGNQVSAVLGIPLSLDDAAAALVVAEARTIDLGEVTLHTLDAPARTSIFIIGCGAGFDARLMATTSSELKRKIGKTAYVAQAIKLALEIGATPYRLTIDGEVIETEASLAMIANMGNVIPGVLRLRLPIEPDDGLLDLIAVGAHGPLGGLRGLADQLTRTSLGGEHGSESIRLRGRTIIVEPQPPAPIQVDGDYVGEGTLEARVLPAALDVLVPAEAS